MDQDPGSRHEFTTVGSRTVYEGAILALRLDQVAMPGGRVAEREVIEHYGAVAVVALDEQDRIVMVDQYRHPVKQRLFELPAGLLDGPGEDPLAAAKRELVEEVGLTAREWRTLVDVAVSPGMTDEVIRVFRATGLEQVERPEPEHEEADLHIHHVPIEQAVRWALDGTISNGTALAGVLALQASRLPGAPELRATDAPWPLRPTELASRKHRR